jgi:integrase
MQGIRWGELAGLQVGDRVMVPGPGLRLSWAVLASNGGGELYVDTLKNKRARTVPLVPVVVPIVDRWSAGKSQGEWLFAAPAGGPLRETNWQRSIGWREAKATIGRPEVSRRGFGLHKLCASSSASMARASPNGTTAVTASPGFEAPRMCPRSTGRWRPLSPGL